MRADRIKQTQSTRGENRPGSQGFGSAGGANAAAGAGSSGNFQGGVEGANNILGGPQAEGGDHDPAYGNLYGNQVPSGHNGAAGGDGY